MRIRYQNQVLDYVGDVVCSEASAEKNIYNSVFTISFINGDSMTLLSQPQKKSECNELNVNVLDSLLAQGYFDFTSIGAYTPEEWRNIYMKGE